MCFMVRDFDCVPGESEQKIIRLGAPWSGLPSLGLLPAQASGVRCRDGRQGWRDMAPMQR